MKLEEILIRPWITEKAAAAQAQANEYFFRVHSKATKTQVRQAVEKLFKVHVEKVRTMNLLGKIRRAGKSMGKRPDWKKAMVKLQAGETIKIFEAKT